MPDLSIKYNNEVIGELDNSGTATLKTAGKKCVSDIEVEYTKPYIKTISLPIYSTTDFSTFKALTLLDTVNVGVGCYEEVTLQLPAGTGVAQSLTGNTIKAGANPEIITAFPFTASATTIKFIVPDLENIGVSDHPNAICILSYGK